MDGQQFDELARYLGIALNRKRFLTTLVGVAAAALVSAANTPLVARKRRRKREGHGRGSVAGQGADPVCAGACANDDDCPDTSCRCNLATGQCQNCGGFCNADDDCLGDCRCFDGFCQSGCPGSCQGGEDCSVFSDECFCVVGACACPTGTCDGSDACPGTCAANADCAASGADACVCFLGVDSADAGEVDRVNAEGNGGQCGSCLAAGGACTATSECCGQLVCSGEGVCARKPTRPSKMRCARHGGSCRRDNDCCAQGVCYKGKCGEKDTHCHNDGECARGYRCHGGPLAPGHRRCRKNGRRKRNKTHRKNG